MKSKKDILFSKDVKPVRGVGFRIFSFGGKSTNTKKQNILSFFVSIFTVLTLVGAGYVLSNDGQVNAGYAVILCVFTVVFLTWLNQECNFSYCCSDTYNDTYCLDRR